MLKLEKKEMLNGDIYTSTNTFESVSIINNNQNGCVVVNIFDNEKELNINEVFDDFDEAVRWTETKVSMEVSFN
jgi:hypothetical protein|tara:strand:+ start:254 stop:475 length:222 start_codon:yes stop_codon:yes gene_type:complete